MGRGNFLPILAATFIILVTTGFILFRYRLIGQIIPSPSPNPTINETNGDEQILILLPQWVPQAKWQPIETTDSSFRDKQLTGIRRSATLIKEDDSFGRFGDEKYFTSNGWIIGDLNADMPGGSTWNYIKNTNGKQRILILSYQNRSLTPNPNGGVSANCPCNFDLHAFLSDPF